MTGDRILVCDPGTQLQRALKVILRDAGYDAQAVATGREALDQAGQHLPVAIIMELALPDLDGIEVCRRLRERGPMPIIVLSSIDDERAKIAAFTNGADDYVTKPFSPGELLARLAARLRAGPSPLRIETDGLMIDLSAHLVTRDGQEIHLTATEFMLLRVLVTSNGTVSHRMLASKVWGLEIRVVPPRLRTHVANLRAKLDRGDRRSFILTEPGIGYRFAGRNAPATGADN
jgi:two-component system KDP operon response regulator KdpE